MFGFVRTGSTCWRIDVNRVCGSHLNVIADYIGIRSVLETSFESNQLSDETLFSFSRRCFGFQQLSHKTRPITSGLVFMETAMKNSEKSLPSMASISAQRHTATTPVRLTTSFVPSRNLDSTPGVTLPSPPHIAFGSSLSGELFVSTSHEGFLEQDKWCGLD